MTARQVGSKYPREHYRKYRANLHDVLDEPGMLYKLSRVLITKSSLTSMENAYYQGCVPSCKTFNKIHEALWIINQRNITMSKEEYANWLLDPVTVAHNS